jgi:hypothetical protein
MPSQPEPARPASSSPKPAAEGRERRRWSRAGADLPLSLRTSDGVREARVRDLSRAGVCFFLDRPLPLMTVLGVALELNGAAKPRRIEGNGAVVRCERIAAGVDHWEVAVFLHEMAEDDRRALERYVVERSV